MENQPLLDQHLPAVIERHANTAWKDFKKFVNRGSVVDLAIGVVIGGAFTEIIDSIVKDLFSPLLGFILNDQLSEIFIILKPGPNAPYNTRSEASKDGAVTWNYGHFVQVILNFMVISISFYIVIKIYGFLRARSSRRHEDVPENEGQHVNSTARRMVRQRRD